MQSTKIWAHRGASGYAPENTMSAFKLAVAQEADGVELDIQLTKDGEIVIVHDEKLDRVSDYKGFVCDYTFEEIKKIDVSRPIPSFGFERIPTLAEVLEELRPTNLSINIECKNGIVGYPMLEEQMIRLVQDMGMTDRIWCSSFNHESVKKVMQLCPEMKTGFLISDVILDVAEYTKRNGALALHPSIYHMRDKELINKCRAQGLAIHVWTVNRVEDMQRMCKAGVDAMITNYPDVAKSVMERL